MAHDRRIQFEGDDAAYVRFLEARIFELEGILQRSFPQEAPVGRIPSPESHGDSSRANSMCESSNNCRRQTISESENSAQERFDDGTRLAFTSQGEHQDVHDRDDTRECTFQVIEYNPSCDANLHLKKGKQAARSESEEGRLQTLSKFTCFISDLPKSKAWKEWVSVSDSQRERFIRGLVQGFASSEQPRVLPPRGSEFTKISILDEYGNSIKSSDTTNRQLTCFRELIFCSLCAVTLRSAERKDDVYEIMRGVFGSDAHSKRFETLVRGAKWVNHAISLLSHTRWALRSWDIILVGM